MKTHALSLEPLTVMDASARQTVDIAARVGFEYVSMILHEPVPMLPRDAIVTDLTLRRETLSAMKAAGIRLSNIECFNLTPEARTEDFAAGLECGHELGARTATAIIMENSDRADALAKYQRLCDMANEFGIRVNVEFFAPAKSMSNLPTAVAFVKDSKRANTGIMVDVLHIFRTGSSIAAVKAMDPELLGGVQISDGPMEMSVERQAVEAGGERQVPGAGELPLREFVESLPVSVIVGIEVPQTSLIGKVAPEERARILFQATRNLYRG